MNEKQALVIVAKAAIGQIPVIGPVAAMLDEIFSQREKDRIEETLKLTIEKINRQGCDIEKIKERLDSPEYTDLLEDGMKQAAHAVSTERKEYISILLKNSLTEYQVEYEDRKMLFSSLSKLDDVQIIMLKFYEITEIQEKREFWEQHEDVLMPPTVCYGASQEDIDKKAFFDSRKHDLENIDLLQKDAKDRYKITRLGSLLIRNIS